LGFQQDNTLATIAVRCSNLAQTSIQVGNRRDLLQGRYNLIRIHPMIQAPTAIFIFLLIAAHAQLRGADPIPAIDPTLDGGVLFKNTCALCHGEKGEGKEELRSPSIAHQPAYYILNQLKSFRENHRGTDPADPQGIMMSAIAKALQPAQLEAVAKHVESLPLVVPKVLEIAGANLKEGQWLFEMRCMECHRFNASGELAFGSPPLVGLQGWYLTAQLEKFKSGKRGAAKGDINGAKMVFTSSFIENEQMLKDLVAYILSLNPSAGSDPFVN